jgi:hypothetical protein
MSGKDKKAQKAKKSPGNEPEERGVQKLILLYKAIEVVEFREKGEEFMKGVY